MHALDVAHISTDWMATLVMLPMVNVDTQVFIGASALASNGAVIAHAGTALVGMVAKTQGIPLLVCAETYKFCERVQVHGLARFVFECVCHGWQFGWWVGAG